jgi:hypothetical protein
MHDAETPPIAPRSGAWMLRAGPVRIFRRCSRLLDLLRLIVPAPALSGRLVVEESIPAGLPGSSGPGIPASIRRSRAVLHEFRYMLSSGMPVVDRRAFIAFIRTSY